MDATEAIAYLRAYDRPLKIMEVCGSHTSSILKNGVRSLLPPGIELVSGPGCPVCVTPPPYIDRLVDAAFRPSHRVLSFGDMLKVRGSRLSLEEARAEGAAVEFVYSPLQAFAMARASPDTTFVMAAIGFETTVPVHALLVGRIVESGITNLRLLTALKTMPAVLDHVCRNEAVDAFLCPGHVSAVIGEGPFRRLERRYGKVFVIAGFEGEHIIAALYAIARLKEKGGHGVRNMYRSVVSGRPQARAAALMDRYFVAGPARWRGIGEIADSGLYLRPEYACLDFGSRDLTDEGFPDGCRCGDVILGRVQPPSCPLFGSVCNPGNAVGACMVSSEGACGLWYRHVGGRP